MQIYKLMFLLFSLYMCKNKKNKYSNRKIYLFMIRFLGDLLFKVTCNPNPIDQDPQDAKL